MAMKILWAEPSGPLLIITDFLCYLVCRHKDRLRGGWIGRQRHDCVINNPTNIGSLNKCNSILPVAALCTGGISLVSSPAQPNEKCEISRVWEIKVERSHNLFSHPWPLSYSVIQYTVFVNHLWEKVIYSSFFCLLKFHLWYIDSSYLI